jgi:uncharacterized protein (TIGR02646 family)
MKYIEKGEEPGAFTEWKKKPDNLQRTWKSFRRTKAKNQLLQALLEEQGYICCYCCSSITKENCHIEHLKPQNEDEKSRFEYKNLMVSCQGEDEDKPSIPVHCGHQKQGWYDKNLFVSPLEPNCAEFFKYSSSGEILPTDNLDKKAASETTIEKLALNIRKLQRMRKKAIDAELLNIEDLNEAEIQQLIKAYGIPDINGQYTPFCTAIIYLLKNYF